MDNLFFRGLLLGFSIAAPVGPIGLLCLQRALRHGLLYGWLSGLGAATADAVYGALAASGLTFIASFFAAQSDGLQLAGALFLCCLGIKIFLTPPAANSAAPAIRGWVAAYTSTFLLTLTNPMTLLSFAAIFAGLGVADTGAGRSAAGWLVGGVFTGSALWWLLLSSSAHWLRPKLDAPRLAWLNKGAGLFLIGFGLFTLSKGVGL